KSFKSIPKTKDSSKLIITQKLHGTNGLFCVFFNEETNRLDLKVGSKNRWLSEDADNHGFYKWAMERKEDIISALGEGWHYGEFVGQGIGNTEGLDKKVFALFNVRLFGRKMLTKRNGVASFLEVEDLCLNVA